MAIYKFGVVGNPVAHSRSPEIHQLFATQQGREISYDKILAPLDGFEQTVSTFFSESDGVGLNITVPFKQQAFCFAAQLTSRAARCGSVNTLKKLCSGEILGDTTDGEGLLRDITENLHTNIDGKNILVLGAGGAVASILEPLLLENPEGLTITNRTLEKAKDLAQRFAAVGNIQVAALADLSGNKFDIVINGTSSSMQNTDLPIKDNIFAKDALAYDMFYSKALTPFLQLAKSFEVHLLADGLGMLVEQAAVSYHLWNGFMPQTAPVISHLRHLLERS